MHKPLSYFVYIKSNKKKAIGMICSIALAILMISTMQFYANNMSDTYYRECTRCNYYSEIWKPNGYVSKDILEKINNSDAVEKIIEVNSHRYMIRNIIGADTDYDGYFADADDIKYICNLMNISLLSGRFPKEGQEEILINENIARAKGLKIGDYMGSDVSDYDFFRGKYKVCGIMKGDNIISFIPKTKEEAKKQSDTYVIIPRKGKMTSLNKILNSFSSSKVNINTKETVQKEYDLDDNNFNLIFNILIIIVIVVLSVCLGNSAYVHYYQRRMEFGLLAASGYTKKEILLRAFYEIFISCLIGFIVGFLITFVFMFLINKLYIYPHGLSYFKIKSDLILRVISIPLFICVFSLIPTSRLLSKIEPISIIERNE